MNSGERLLFHRTLANAFAARIISSANHSWRNYPVRCVGRIYLPAMLLVNDWKIYGTQFFPRLTITLRKSYSQSDGFH